MVMALFALCAIGLAQIYSATGGPTRIYITQIYGIVLGVIAMLICLSIDYRTLADKSHFIYIGVIVLLVYVLFFGAVRGGSRRWIDLGIVNLQPSELAKAAVALVLAKFFGENRRGVLSRGDLFIAAALVAVPAIIIARQPDLGTAVTLVPVLFAVAYLAGMPMRIFGIVALVGVLAAPVAWKFALQDYQKGRGGAQRLHLLGACRGAGFCRRVGDARSLFVRHCSRARCRESRKRQAGRVPGAGSAGQLLVPGRL
jgi:rod shape determining protein RodA